MAEQTEIEPRDGKQVLLVGAGLAGQLAALALAKAGCRVQLVAPQPPQVHPGDPFGNARTTALLGGAVQYLRAMGLWKAVAAAAEPLVTMQLIDPQGRGCVTFHAADAPGQVAGAFGFNLPNQALTNALAEAISSEPAITVTSGLVSGVDRVADRVALRLQAASGGPPPRPLVGQLLVAADGGRSVIRERCRISAQHRDYHQFALTFVVESDQPHGQVSTEFHYPTGPLTLVPLPGNRQSIVFVCASDEGRARLSWPPERLLAELAVKAQGLLGRADQLRLLAGPGGYPIHGLLADRLVDHRLVLLGEAAHALPPIGAQGLNSTLLDVAWLADALRGQRDPGAPAGLRAYEARRKADIGLRFTAIDRLNRWVLSPDERMSALRGQLTGLAGQWQLVQQALIGVGMIGPAHFPASGGNERAAYV